MLKAHHVQVVPAVKVCGLCNKRIAGGSVSNQVANGR